MASPAARPLLALDSASLYYRAYYALPSSMTAPDGRPHNAIRGFLSTLTRLVDTHSPGALIACWDDDWRPQWRVDLLPSYKSHRVAEEADGTGAAAGEAEPEDLGPQVTGLATLLDCLGIARWGAADHEADDVLGSIVHQHDGPVIVVSGDRDLVQLVNDHTRLLLTVNGGMEKWPLLDEAGVLERFGVPADRYVDLAALRGDPSDGLPGVSGIGAKTGVALVNAFGGWDGIIDAAQSAPSVRPMTPRLAGAVIDARDYLERAVRVATVVGNLPLGTFPTTLTAPGVDEVAVEALAREWGVTRQVSELRAAIRRQTDAE